MHELLHGMGIVILYFIICVLTVFPIRIFTKIPDEIFRKLLHCVLLGSLTVWTLSFEHWWLVSLSSIGFAVLVYPILWIAERLKGYSHVVTERKSGELKSSLLIVFFMFALVVAFCWGAMGDKLLALACIYAWGFGDAVAALVGKQWGKHKITWKGTDGKKSVEGTMAMLIVSFFSVGILLGARGGLGWFGILLTSMITATVSALTELYTRNGLDTITCPMAAMAVMLPMLYLFGGVLS